MRCGDGIRFTWQCLGRLSSVVCAALILTVVFPSAGTKPAALAAAAETARVSEHQGNMIARRADARVERLIRLAQKSKDKKDRKSVV